jgi:FemAB-related protein (PEP-CTERM system-associated)
MSHAPNSTNPSTPLSTEPSTIGEGYGLAVHRVDPRWLRVLSHGLAQQPYPIVSTTENGQTGSLPLMLVESKLFGRFLVSLPYLNTAGVFAENDDEARRLIDDAVALADRLDVRYLELRHERLVEHPKLTGLNAGKVHMRLQLPTTVDKLWSGFKTKLRNQIRKGETQPGSAVFWGRHDLLNEFYDVFSRNMRDLGTPTYGRRLFQSILDEFPEEAEICVIRHGTRAVAAALLCHQRDVTRVPSASSLKQVNSTNANMYLYWQLLQRAVVRGSTRFDFGRSTKDSNTYRFKAQWGAIATGAVWQYYVRRGTMSDMRPESGRYRLATRVWQRLPLIVSRALGPYIVRGIP